jgi:hypothetical protein
MNFVAALQVLLQGRRIQIAQTLPDASVLVKELENFELKPAPTADADPLLSQRTITAGRRVTAAFQTCRASS